MTKRETAFIIDADEGCDVEMSAVADAYVYRVKITDRETEKHEPTVSLETLQAYKADVEKYKAQP